MKGESVMVRGQRLDAPGTLHHVIIRGIEQGSIVRDNTENISDVSQRGDSKSSLFRN